MTGASGFIGRWSVPVLIAAGFEVHAVAGPSAARALPDQLRGAHVHHLDLLDAASVDAVVRRIAPSHLLHFAWIATPGLYATSVDNTAWLAASQALLQSFHLAGGSRAVMAGSCAEYDWSRASVCDEFTSPLADTGSAAPTAYARCKLAMQAALQNAGRTHGSSTAWGRIFFQFGPDEHPARLVASVIDHLLRGREAPCSHGRQVRSFLHVADVGAAFAALLDSMVEGPVNIGSGERMTLAELLERIAGQIGRRDLVRLGALHAPPGEPAVLVPDVGRLSREVGWRPRFTLDEGIADTIDWWRSRAMNPTAGAGR